MVAAIEQGFPQREIERRAYEHQRAVESGERVIVGVNKFTDEPGGAPPPLHRLDPALEAAQVARLDAAAGGAATEANYAPPSTVCRRRRRGTDNLFPAILAAVKARATLGEIADMLRNTFGEYRPT